MTLLSRLVAHIEAHPEFLRQRASWYTLRSVMDQIRAEHGLGAAMGASAELYARVGDVVPGEPTGKSGSRWITENVGEVLNDAVPLEWMNGIIEKGDFAGHPRWHSRNPWFHLWMAASADTSQVAAFWQQNEAATQPRDLAYSQGLLKSFTETPNPGRDELAKLILEFIEDNGRPPRLLDIGCGVGNWLAWCVLYAGVGPEDCYGVDQLAGRIAGAQALGATVGIPVNNFGVMGVELPEGLRPDIVILAAVTGCGDDAWLTDLVYRVGNTGARYVFETHAIDSTSNWIGRANSDAFFERAGYRPLRSKMCGDVLTKEGLSALVLPCKYFLSIRAAIYERGE